MGLSVVTPPAADPLSLIEAKDHCEITSLDRDGLIARYIFAARAFIEDSTHLKLVTQTLDLTLDRGWPCVSDEGYYCQRIEFPVKPVASVTSVTYVDTNGSTQTLAADQYALRNKGPVHYLEAAYGVTWPSVRCQGEAITVRFVAGWAVSDVPDPLVHAMRMLVAHAERNREAVLDGTFSEVPLGVEAFLSGYRFSRF